MCYSLQKYSQTDSILIYPYFLIKVMHKKIYLDGTKYSEHECSQRHSF